MTAALGGVLLLVGLLGNEWLVRAALMPELRLSAAGRTGWLILEMLLVAWGALCLWKRRDARLRRLNRLLVVSAVALPFALELLLRLGIAMGVERFRDPGLYADWSSEDEYWRLLWHWQPESRSQWTDNVANARLALPAPGEVHPTLGWAPPRSAENPLGVIGYKPATGATPSAPILFFGDSFVAGMGKYQSIPEVLESKLAGSTVHNFGVGGYGLGQIYLRLCEALPHFESPLVLVGVLTTDLDRIVLSVRTAPKPRYALEGNELRLHGVPIPENPRIWLDENPPQTSSYLLSWLVRRFRSLAAAGDPLDVAFRKREKQRLGSRLIAEIAAECKKQGVPVGFVVFHTMGEIQRPSWRGAFLVEELKRQGLPFVDTWGALQRESKGRWWNERPPEFWPGYSPEHQHLTDWGNNIVADAIVEQFTWLKKSADQLDEPPPPPPPPPPPEP